jgi:hypothetical protein
MVIRYNKKNYIFNITDNKVYLMGKLVEGLTDKFKPYIRAARERKFHLHMTYREFETHIAILNEKEREQLFHNVYQAYLYANTYINSKSISTQEFHKAMARLKRFEQYLYRIINS